MSYDAVAKATGVQRRMSYDAVAGVLRVTKRMSFDAVAQKTQKRRMSYDVANPRLPTELWKRSNIRPLVLIEVRLRKQTLLFSHTDVHYAGRSWSANLVTSGVIQRTMAGGTDTVSIELQDTGSNPKERLRAIFDQDLPEAAGVSIFMGLREDATQSLVHVFEGNVQQIQYMGLTTIVLNVAREDLINDTFITRPVNRTEFPLAPEEAVGRSIPQVFGTLVAHEAVVVDTNAVSELTEFIFVPSLSQFLANAVPESISLKDATEFPSAGEGFADDELISWTGKSGNTLTGLTRGVDGTKTAEHSPRSKFTEDGSLKAKLADHPLISIRRIRIIDPNGDLQETVPAPSLVDFTTATITWDRLPRLRQPFSETFFQRIHADREGPGNLALDATRAAHESSNFATFGFAQTGAGGTLELLTNVDGLGEPGELKRVSAVVVFDPEGFTSAQFQMGSVPQVFALAPVDIIDKTMARRDEKTNNEPYDVEDNSIVTPPPDLSEDYSPERVVDPGMFAHNAPKCVDGDVDTEAGYMAITVGDVNVVGGAAQFQIPDPLDVDPANRAVSASLTAVVGWTTTPLTAPMRIFLQRAGGLPGGVPEPGTEIPMNNAIVGIETFSVSFDPAILGPGLLLEEAHEFIVWVIPKAGNIGAATFTGIWVLREVWISATYERDPGVDIDIDDRKTVVNYFDITANVQGDWGFFGDLLRGGTMRVIGPNMRVLQMFYVAEHQPYVDLSSRVPRVFADVISSRVPDGNPVDICEALIRDPFPFGIGRGADAVNRRDYNPARSSVAADGLRLDFAVTRPTHVVPLLRKIADQADLRQVWELGRHRVFRKPAADPLLDVPDRDLGPSDVIDPRNTASVKAQREPTTAIRTRIEVRFAFYAPSGKTSDVISEELTAQLLAEQNQVGIRRGVEVFDLVQDPTTALFVAKRLARREAVAHWLPAFQMPLNGLELRFGDLISLSGIPELSFAVGEILSLPIDTNFSENKPIMVDVQAIVWHKTL